MRIAVCAPYYKPAYVYGGPVRSISSLCESLSRLGMDVTVLTTDANGPDRLQVPLGQPVSVEGVNVWYFPLARNGSFFYSPALVAACMNRMGEHDLAVLEGLWSHALTPAARACRRVRIPYVMPLRGQLLPWALAQKKWKKRLYLALRGWRLLSGAAALHCTDQGEAEEALALGLQALTFVVPNGVDTTRFFNLPERGALRRRWGIPSQAQVLLFLGRLHRKKRPDIAVASLAAAQKLPGEVHMVLAGPDEQGLGPALLAQARQAGCDHRLHLEGLLKDDEVLQALADADLMLMPSEPQSENFGMSAAEALAAGLPILVSEGVPVGRWAQEAKAGRMVPCRVEDFCQAACELLSDANGLKKMGENGRILAKTKFDLPAVATQLLAQFRAIILTGKPLPS